MLATINGASAREFIQQFMFGVELNRAAERKINEEGE